MKQTRWKNGGGTTSEIAIFPPSADLAQLDFDWRLSIATVSSDGPFSRFPGYDRYLVVWKGSGFLLNKVERKNLEPFHFAGEEEIEAKLLSDEVKDFGLIFKRGRVQAEITVHTLKENGSSVMNIQTETQFILCAQGELRIGEFYVNPGEVVRVEFEGAGGDANGETTKREAHITALAQSCYVVVSLRSSKV